MKTGEKTKARGRRPTRWKQVTAALSKSKATAKKKADAVCCVPLFDNDWDSISSEESLLNEIDEESIASDDKDDGCGCFDTVFSPTDCVTDFMFCRLQCAFPDMVDDVDEILSNDLHHLIFQEQEEVGEEAGGEAKVAALTPRILFDEAGGKLGEEGVETALIPSPNEQRRGSGGGDAHGDEEGGGTGVVLIDDRKDSKEVEVVLGRWTVMQTTQVESASYSPEAGFELRKDGKLPEPSEDEVLIRVEAATLSTRDCLETIRRDSNEELQNDIWVPGHEIVGHVVSTGMNAKFLLDKRVAALMPHGGGCSQYVCINAEDAIALPEEAGSDEMVALLSTYMTAYQCLESVIGREPEERKNTEPEEEEEDVESEEEEDEEADVKPREILLAVDDAGQKRSPLFGKNVLIVGAGSPVGLALVDLARNAGAIIYTLSHSSHWSAINKVGAKYWHRLSQKELWEAKWRGQMDLIVDAVGDSDYNSSFYTVMKTRGRLVRVNITSCEKTHAPLTGQGQGEQGLGLLGSYKERVLNDKAIDYDIFNSFNDDKELFTEDLAYLHGLLHIGKIRPKIFSRACFGELEDEWEKAMTGGTNGVLVVSPWTFGFTRVMG